MISYRFLNNFISGDKAQCAGPPPKPGEKTSFAKALLSGGITGGIEITCTYPTEYIKTMQQLYPDYASKSMMGCARHTMAEQGFLGLYKGYTTLLAFSVPKTGVRFAAKQFFDANVFTTPSTLATFLSGACAGATEAIVVVTMQETVKVKIVHDILKPEPKFKGFFHGLGSIYKAEGFKGIYRGPIPTVMKQSSNQAIRFLVYGKTKDKFDQWFPNKWTQAKYATAGAIAGAASVFGNTPIDVIKTKMQGLDAHLYKNAWDCCKQTWAEGGFKGFYAGLVPRLSRVVLDVAITFTLFENIKNLLNYLFP